MSKSRPTFSPTVSPTFSPRFSPTVSSIFKPISSFPIIKSSLYSNLLTISSKNKINVDYSTINVSNYKITLPYSIKLEGDIYFAYDISIPVIPHLYCEEFNPTIFKLSDISVTNIQYPGTNTNMYYFKLSINQLIPMRSKQQNFPNIRIYLSNPTPDMISTPVLDNTIIFDTFTYTTIKPFLFPKLITPLPSFLIKYNTSPTDGQTILSETFTGFDIFGQFNLSKINEFGLNSTDIYKIIYMNNSTVNNSFVPKYYDTPIWTDRYVTPMLSDASLKNQSVTIMNDILSTAKFINFTKDNKILAAPYKYSFISYQYKINPVIILNVLQNGFNVTSEPYNSILDLDESTIKSIKEKPPTPITELNHTQIYVGQIFCNPVLFDLTMAQIKTWPKNAFEFNIAFFSYITYLMYDQINKTLPINISKTLSGQNKIKIFKITTPYRMNSPFIYRVDITSFLLYLKNTTTKAKLENYKKLTSTVSIDLPTALLIAYYDKNPQSIPDRNAELTPQALLNSYYANQSVLSGEKVPTVGTTDKLSVQNVIERFDNININKELNNKYYNEENKINNQYVKYALF
jgi:hypothetical protein